MGMRTTWVGAILGGSTRPSSSEWVMITAPISRVETPHEVVQQYSSVPDGLANLISWAWAKFCPRKCDVPAWSALPSCIIASIE